MSLFESFVNRSPNTVFFSLILGIASGICYASIIPIVLAGFDDGVDHAYSDNLLPPYNLWGIDISNENIAFLFFIICIFILISRSYSQISMLRVSLEATTVLRIKIYKRILEAPIDKLENIGAAKLILTIGTDVGRIVLGSRLISDVMISVVTIFGMLGFLMYLDAAIFWFTIKAIFFGIVSYQIPIFYSNKYFTHSRMISDSRQEAINGLIYGIKELKLCKNKRDTFFNKILVNSEHAVFKYDKFAHTINRAAVNYGDLISFFVIGIVAFIFRNYHDIGEKQLVGVIMALFYITTPVAVVMNSIPNIILAKVSLKKVSNVLSCLPAESISSSIKELKPWNEVTLEGISYRYHGNGDDKGFEVGPINLTLRRGEITFLVGGNGSGKSTLSKLLTLHYLPHNGSIYFGENKLEAGKVGSFRNCICSIYSDYYLFDQLLYQPNDSEKSQIEKYLTLLKLDEKVAIVDRRFSTLALSDGQRKRLALLVSFLEDKDIYLFDEWAADQDPIFKDVFYRNILPTLKKRNKVIVVVSHDDRYFNIAQKLVIMDEGKITQSKLQTSTLSSNTIDTGYHDSSPNVFFE